MEYYEKGGGAVARLGWQSPSQARQIIPASQLYAPAPSGGTPAPLPPSDGLGTGLTGQYYDNADFSALAGTRIDATINFDWGGGAPDPTMGADTFSVRWTGRIEPRHSETYTFYTTSDDGVRLWINGQLVIDNWGDHAPTENASIPVSLAAGQKYDIRMEYYENGGGAVARLEWRSASQTRQIVPQSQLYPAN
jgi:hypothetical protein